jgi:hypothetical protein
MNKQRDYSTEDKMPNVTAGCRPRSRVLTVMAVTVMGASLILTSSVFAHNISLKAAREKAREYARSVRDAPGRNYEHYETDCTIAFPGHNHYVRCTLFFQNAEDRKSGKWTCKERIEVYFRAHQDVGLFDEGLWDKTMYLKHTSQKTC